MSSNYIRKKQLKIAMIGHKVVPSRRGGIELVLTTMCPKMVKRGHQVTCYNRSGDKVENEYVNTVKNGTYKGVKLKKVLTINKKGLAAMTSSFSAAIRADMILYIFMQKDLAQLFGFRNYSENVVS